MATTTVEYRRITTRIEYDENYKPSVYLVGDWPELTLISQRVVDEGDRSMVWQDGDAIFFRLTDTSAVYQIFGDYSADIVKARLLSIGDAPA